MESPKGASSMLDSPLRKKTASHSSAPPSPSWMSRPPSHAADISQQASGGVILPPESFILVPDIGAGVTSEGNVAPEHEVHHAGADMPALDIERDLGASDIGAEHQQAKTPEKPEQEKDHVGSPK